MRVEASMRPSAVPGGPCRFCPRGSSPWSRRLRSPSVSTIPWRRAMAELRRVPAGRAGRIWLTRRLHSGRLAADLLDRKLQVLRIELESFELQRERTRRRWQQAWREADLWGLRGAMAGGDREVRLATPSTPASLRVEWDTVMGVRYPAEADCEPP